ncbi:probable E3 ubiquitin-protein ligase HIP1 [Camellia sinensis]|nr:probable E3 ubiquitin-protein ligase HIP1 [Camellia sinensis]XP_028056440.1 probable E3 ubiquitin-protein ligase HIP1 [Camellia sinensis]
MEHRSHSSNSLNLEENMGTFQRNTCQRTDPGAEQSILFSSVSSSSNVGASTSELGITSQNVMASSAFPINYHSWNGFSGGVHLSSTPGFPLRNLVEEYEERLSNFLEPIILRPVDSMMREEHNAAVPSIVAALEQFSADRRSALQVAFELLQVANGATWQYEDGMIVGPFFDEPDMHEDMRLELDNMSYEELLALEERMGNVKSGLSVDSILGGVKQHRYQSMKLGVPVEEEPCCICQEEYDDGEKLGKLDCGHEFHFDCIKQWLMQKNSCPICKRTALAI